MENYNNLIELAKETNDFIYELQSHKEVEQSKKLACKEFLNLLNESFSEEKAADALKQVIYVRLKTDKNELTKGDKGKTYRNMLNYFEGKTNTKGEPCKFTYPTRDSLIQICFDFDISSKDEINRLFDKMYYERLYLKDSRDFVIYCCLTKFGIRDEIRNLHPGFKNDLQRIDKFIESKHFSSKRDNLDNGFNDACKFTAELYNEIDDDISNLEDVIKYYNTNMPLFCQQRQYSVQKYLSSMVKFAGNSLLANILFSDFDDSDDQRSSIYKKLWASFSTFNKGGKGGHDVDVTYIGEKIKTEDFIPALLKELEKTDYKINRGTFLLMYLCELAIKSEQNGLDNVDWQTKVNVKLDAAGFATFNYEGVLLDKIIYLFFNASGFYSDTVNEIFTFISFVSRVDIDGLLDD